MDLGFVKVTKQAKMIIDKKDSGSELLIFFQFFSQDAYRPQRYRRA